VSSTSPSPYRFSGHKAAPALGTFCLSNQGLDTRIFRSSTGCTARKTFSPPKLLSMFSSSVTSRGRTGSSFYLIFFFLPTEVVSSAPGRRRSRPLHHRPLFLNDLCVWFPQLFSHPPPMRTSSIVQSVFSPFSSFAALLSGDACCFCVPPPQDSSTRFIYPLTRGGPLIWYRFSLDTAPLVVCCPFLDCRPPRDLQPLLFCTPVRFPPTPSKPSSPRVIFLSPQIFLEFHYGAPLAFCFSTFLVQTS